MKISKNIFVSTTFAKDNSKISDSDRGNGKGQEEIEHLPIERRADFYSSDPWYNPKVKTCIYKFQRF